MEHNTYIYIAIMAIVTYLIRVLPLTLIRKKITTRLIRSFLFYVPYVTLSVMTFPAILEATESFWSALTGFVIAVIVAWKGGSLVKVAAAACISVFIIELFLC